MIRLTIHTINSVGAPQYPLKVHTLRYPVICGMKDSEVQQEIEKFKVEHPGRTLIDWKKDVLRLTPEQESLEMSAEQGAVEPEPEVLMFEEPI